jgi:hypothetical protein
MFDKPNRLELNQIIKQASPNVALVKNVGKTTLPAVARDIFLATLFGATGLQRRRETIIQKCLVTRRKHLIRGLLNEPVFLFNAYIRS